VDAGSPFAPNDEGDGQISSALQPVALQLCMTLANSILSRPQGAPGRGGA
jgi:hypothetical protein